jgi:3-hydroxyisobutyrate dehydrogenase-like beta-hydroxyacid dehydrogenase
MSRPVVGFVGLGAMGSHMATRLIGAGYALVVYNRTAERAEPLARLGAQTAASPRDVVNRADVICGCLLDGAAVEDVYRGEAGLIGASRKGQVFIEHGTFAPDLARAVARELHASGAAFLDAPVTGGPEAALAGTLTTMVGGDGAAVAAASEVIGAYAARVCYVGPSGAGLELKLVNQLLVSCHVAAAAEAAAMIRRLDLPLDAAAEVLNSGWAESAMLRRGLRRLGDQQLDESEATIGGLVEPQRLLAELAEQAGLSLTLMPIVAEMFQRATVEGLGDSDLAALVRLVEGAPTEADSPARTRVAG